MALLECVHVRFGLFPLEQKLHIGYCTNSYIEHSPCASASHSFKATHFKYSLGNYQFHLGGYGPCFGCATHDGSRPDERRLLCSGASHAPKKPVKVRECQLKYLNCWYLSTKPKWGGLLSRTK